MFKKIMFLVCRDKRKNSMKKIIELKCLPPYFRDIETKKKAFEIRFNDKDFNVGDYIILREYIIHDSTFTGNYLILQVTYILKEFRGIKKDHCCFCFNILASGFSMDVENVAKVLNQLIY